MQPLNKFKALSVSVVIFGACSTGGSHRSSDYQERSDVWAVLQQEPDSISSAVQAANHILQAYDHKLRKADKVRRGFNLANIASTTYTFVGAALQVHPHNLIASTALTSILPKVEDNLQSNGSPETLGSAMTKTVCVVRAGNFAISPSATRAQKYLSISSDPESLAAVANYERLKNTIVNGYMQVYADYSTNKSAARFDSAKFLETLSQQSAGSSGGDPKTNEDHSFFGSGGAVTLAIKKEHLAILRLTTDKTIQDINHCLGISSEPAGQ